MTPRRILLGLALLIFLGIAVFLAWAWQPAIAAIAPPSKASFDPALVQQGAALAGLGYCNVCHTRPGGAAFAGGRPMATPFGTIYATNITPDPDTGIGRWSEAAFTRAMHDGVSRDGHYLYPAFPYDHFTKLTDDDLRALYAFMMTRIPVGAETPPNQLPFPLNVRFLLAGWNLLFLEKGRYRPDPSKPADWNRGAYLAEGLSHCGACHTPRNRFGAEKRSEAYAGGDAEGWHALALNAAQPAPVPWTANSLFAYLRSGSDEEHGVAAGPMEPVFHNLARVPEADVRAITIYMASIAGPSDPERQRRAAAARAREQSLGNAAAAVVAVDGQASVSAAQAGTDDGAVIYAGACARCHGDGAPLAFSARSLALHPDLFAPAPANLIHVTLEGIHPREGERYYWMPGFADVLTDRQVAAVVTYLRKELSDQPPWADVEDDVRRIRAGPGG